MSTLMEDRLTAALRARADLVQPEDLQHHSPQPTRSTPLWRRPVVIALVAAAAVAAIVLPLALRGDNTTQQPLKLSHHWPPAPHHGQPTQQLADHLTGDVDGDGSADQIRESGHTLTVTLAADPAHPLTQSNPHLGGLVGLADIGRPGAGDPRVRPRPHGRRRVAGDRAAERAAPARAPPSAARGLEPRRRTRILDQLAHADRASR